MNPLVKIGAVVVSNPQKLYDSQVDTSKIGYEFIGGLIAQRSMRTDGIIAIWKKTRSPLMSKTTAFITNRKEITRRNAPTGQKIIPIIPRWMNMNVHKRNGCGTPIQSHIKARMALSRSAVFMNVMIIHNVL